MSAGCFQTTASFVAAKDRWDSTMRDCSFGSQRCARSSAELGGAVQFDSRRPQPQQPSTTDHGRSGGGDRSCQQAMTVVFVKTPTLKLM